MEQRELPDELKERIASLTNQLREATQEAATFVAQQTSEKRPKIHEIPPAGVQLAIQFVLQSQRSMFVTMPIPDEDEMLMGTRGMEEEERAAFQAACDVVYRYFHQVASGLGSS